MPKNIKNLKIEFIKKKNKKTVINIQFKIGFISIVIFESKFLKLPTIKIKFLLYIKYISFNIIKFY